MAVAAPPRATPAVSKSAPGGFLNGSTYVYLLPVDGRDWADYRPLLIQALASDVAPDVIWYHPADGVAEEVARLMLSLVEQAGLLCELRPLGAETATPAAQAIDMGVAVTGLVHNADAFGQRVCLVGALVLCHHCASCVQGLAADIRAQETAAFGRETQVEAPAPVIPIDPSGLVEIGMFDFRRTPTQSHV
jgi:hypothetical protein